MRLSLTQSTDSHMCIDLCIHLLYQSLSNGRLPDVFNRSTPDLANGNMVMVREKDERVYPGGQFAYAQNKCKSVTVTVAERYLCVLEYNYSNWNGKHSASFDSKRIFSV